MKPYPSTNILNRELSWLHFNDRVLEEGARDDVPILERAKFISIFSSNLDEFFGVRVGSLRDQRQAKYKKLDVSGLTAKEQIKQIFSHTRKAVQRQSDIYRQWLKEYEGMNSPCLTIESLSRQEVKNMERYFKGRIYPSLCPLVLDQSITRFANGRLHLLVKLRKGKMGIVQLPPLMDRMIEGEDAVGRPGFFFLEEIIGSFLHFLFPDDQVGDWAVFRVTRSADIQVAVEDAGDLLEVIEQALPQRENGRIIRVEIEGKQDWAIAFLTQYLGVKPRDFIEVEVPLDLTCLNRWNRMEEGEQGHFQVFEAAEKEWWKGDVFEAIRKQDRIHMVPYEKFDPVIRFLEQAVQDPQVIAIQQTLYRVSDQSSVVEALRQAALNGKQVTVVIELRARFDEENNIRWARTLEEAGCQVIYGHPIQKVHTKAIVVIRQEDDGLRTYLHLGTGNYNEVTAKLYTDFGYFTANSEMAQDVSRMFHYITGSMKIPEFTSLAVAPFTLRTTLMDRIAECIRSAKRGEAAWIFLKMNSLVDTHMIEALYEASKAGVEVDCLVRGICCLRPGLKGVSENIHVKSIVGRFLEHQRVFCFSTGSWEKLYLSSADWMPRNLNRRVELMFPVTSPFAIESIKGWMRLQWQDENRAHRLKSDGTYRPLSREKGALDSQACFIGELMERSRT